jgi:hypothetical protein
MLVPAGRGGKIRDDTHYIIKIKNIDVTATGSVNVVALVKYKNSYATLEFQSSGGWKIHHDDNFPTDVIIDAKNEIWRRIQKIIEKIDEILALGNGLGLTIVFK